MAVAFSVFGLFTEINTIFLHLYRIMRSIGWEPGSLGVRTNTFLMVVTLVILRVIGAVYLLMYVILSRDQFPTVNFVILVSGVLTLLIINYGISLRVFTIVFIKSSKVHNKIL
ncbi:hypothetical protein RF11_04207 [Thelohanellus kitauei]|uniref:TLC domain-containing protein n=1 Tax=Thelohanellus kitauei TaxID=669202 RepID=A0A0C2N5C5_THEKT|nr:hypothetical protein RF11_04207 [Thelohanellus kitauei]